jgi:hypothetical protein
VLAFRTGGLTMKAVIEQIPTFIVQLKDGRVLQIKATHYVRSFDCMSYEFYQQEPKSKVFPISTIKSSMVEYIYMEGTVKEFEPAEDIEVEK